MTRESRWLDRSTTNASRWPLLRIFLINSIACTVISAILWSVVPAIGRHGLWSTFLHSQLIGGAICLLIVGWYRIAARHEMQGSRITYFAVPVLGLVGAVMGIVLARAILGHSVDSATTISDESLLPSLLAALVATPILTALWVLHDNAAQLRLAASEEAGRAQAAKLAMLRAQIEPHMLFNTLANLRALITIDPPRAITMLDRFDAFLRATLDSSRSSTITWAREFGMIDDYLSIMQIRLGQRLTYSLDLSPALAGRIVPTMLIQPLVENAIRHGIEPSMTGGHIAVSALPEGSGAIVRISDTGVGIADHAAAAGDVARRQAWSNPGRYDGYPPHARRPVDASGGGGVGLDNLRARLAAWPGCAGRVEIESPLAGCDHGTLIMLHLPEYADAH